MGASNVSDLAPNLEFSGLYFLVFGLNKEKYSVSLRIKSKCGKIRIRKTPNTDTFHAVPIRSLIHLSLKFHFYTFKKFPDVFRGVYTKSIGLKWVNNGYLGIDFLEDIGNRLYWRLTIFDQTFNATFHLQDKR